MGTRTLAGLALRPIHIYIKLFHRVSTSHKSYELHLGHYVHLGHGGICSLAKNVIDRSMTVLEESSKTVIDQSMTILAETIVGCAVLLKMSVTSQ